MPSFYFLWNPTKRPDLSEKLGKISGLLPDDKRLRKYWSTGSRTAKNFPSGSRFFLVRTKIEPHGVIGYGTILTGKLLPGAHPWKDGKKAAYVKINFENLIDSQKNPEKVLSLEFLETAGFKLKVSKPQGGGTEIPDEAAAQIKARFDGLLAPTIEELLELDPQLETKELAAPEGRTQIKEHLVRERNRALVKKKKRAVLSTTGGLACEVCTLDFLQRYGELGRGFAECHHLTPLILLDKASETKLKDLAIVCANCHRMLHRGEPWKTITRLKDIVSANKNPMPSDVAGKPRRRQPCRN